MEGLLIFGFAFGLLFAIVYFGFVKPFKENTEKSGETFKGLLEKGAKYQQARKDLKPKNTVEEPLIVTLLMRIVAPLLLMFFIIYIFFG